MGFKLKRTKADDLFSQLVRLRDGYQCVRCRRQHEKSENTCDASHYWGRSYRSVRFDLENADTLCKLPCHTGRWQSSLGWEYQKQLAGKNGVQVDGAYTVFKKKQLGEKAFNRLFVRAHRTQKVDEKLIVLWIEKELEQYKAEENIFGKK